MSSTKICYYQILEVEKSADLDQIKKSYKKLAMKWHPDKNPNDIQHAKEKFREISEAYQVLSDTEKRLNYDKYGFEGPKSKAFSGFGFDDADNLFKSFFKTAGFDNHDDEDFFSSIFKTHGIKGGFGGFGGFSGFGRMEGFGKMPNLKSKFSMFDDDDFFKNSISKHGMLGQQPKFGSGYGLTRSENTTTKIVDGKQITTKKITVFKEDGSQEITEETMEGDKKIKKIYSLGASEIAEIGKKSVKNY